MSETNVSLNAELRDELADEIEAKIAESKKADVLLDVDDLCVTLFTEDGELPAIRHLNFVMRKGETLAVVGESGCGKSMTALSIMGLLPSPPQRSWAAPSTWRAPTSPSSPATRCAPSAAPRLA